MSRRLQHKTRRAALLFAAVLLAFVCAPLVCAPNPAWASNDTATITAKVRVFQEYQVSVSGLENTFTYQIIPNENDASLPVDESGEAFDSFTLTRTDDRWLEFVVPVAMDPSAKSYAYHYTLKPANTKLADGLYYVDVLSTSLDAGVNVYYLELYVQPSSEDAALATVTPLVHVKGWDGPKTTDPGWRIGYKANTPSDPGSQGGGNANTPSDPGSQGGGNANTSPDPGSQEEYYYHTPPDPNSPGPPSPIPDPHSPGSSSPQPELTYDSDERSSVDSGNDSSNSPATSSTTKGAATSNSAPAKTGDALAPWFAAACIACAVALLLVLTCLHRRKAGEDDA